MNSQQPYHHNDLKKALIEKGIELVNTEGIKSLSLRKIASACGVSHAAPYSHFESKEKLLNAMQDHITDEFSKVLEDSIDLYINEPDVLVHLGEAYVVFFINKPQYFSFLYRQSNMHIDLSFKGANRSSYKPFEIYKKMALNSIGAMNYPEENQKDVVIVLWSLIHRIASLATMKNVYYDEDWKLKITDFIRLFNCVFSNNNQENKV